MMLSIKAGKRDSMPSTIISTSFFFSNLGHIRNRNFQDFANFSAFEYFFFSLLIFTSRSNLFIASSIFSSKLSSLFSTARPRSAPILQTGLPKNKTVQVGDNATFTCIVLVSGTLPDFRWLKWNKSVNSIPKTYNEILNGSYRLIDPYYYKIVQVKSNYGVEVNIVNVTEEDFGLYTCFVSNHIGNDFSSAFLIKYVKPTVPVTGQYLFKTRRRNLSYLRT